MMCININGDCYTIIYVLFIMQTNVLSGTFKMRNFDNNIAYERISVHESPENYASSEVKPFDIGDYNFTDYFRKIDQQKKPKEVIKEGFSENIMKYTPTEPISNELKRNLRLLLRSPEAYTSIRSGNSRFLDLFNVVKFENKPCSSQSDLLATTEGTCYHKTECDRMGGLAIGPCAKGFGVCCIFSLSCGSMSLQNVSYFDSPGFPKPTYTRLACAITVVALTGVQQFRLDFDTFELQPPTNGTCVEDQFVISGQDGNKLPPICGINTGQHMYLDVSQSRYLMMSVLTNSEQARQFRVKITQLRPEQSVPKGCLQYYDSLQGRIESFNYADASRIIDARRPGYFNNMNYAVCIGRAPGYCAVTYFNEDFFQIANSDPDGESLIPPEQAGAEVFSCPDDFIIINGVRLCGERLNDASLIEDFTIDAPVTEYGAGPITLAFRSNGNVTGRGFRLLFRQEQCPMDGIFSV